MQQHLGPIWDAIDDEQWPLALQLTEKTQKRYRTPQKTLLSLQGLCLIHLDRPLDAIAACETIRKLGPDRPDTYQTLHDVLKSANTDVLVDYLVSTLEAGFREIQNEFMGRLWFMEAVRTGRLSAQRRAATALQKGFLGREYFFQHTITIYLQYRKSKDEKERKLLGMLMHRMISKAAANVAESSSDANHGGAVSGPRLESLEEVYLYIDILRELGQVEEILRTLDGPLGAKYSNVQELKRLQIELHVDSKEPNREQVKLLCEEQIRNGVDDWTIFRTYIDSCESQPHAETFLFSVAAPKLTRNQSLATVYLHNMGTSNTRLYDSLLEYFRNFSNKLATFEDLAPYVRILEAEQAESWLKEVDKFEAVSDIDRVLMQTNIAKFRFSLSRNAPDEVDRTTVIKTLLSDYSSSLLLGNALEETDNQYGDDLLLLAVSLILEDQPSSSSAQLAITLLEFGLTRSKHNFQFRLKLIALYRQLSAWSQAHQHFLPLGVKHVQRDTLTHILHQSAVHEYISTLQLNALKLSQGIYQSNKVETPDMICQAYENGTYSKIVEFLEFQERLEHSIWRIESSMGIHILNLLLDKFDWNLDLSTHIALLDGPLFDNKSHVTLDITSNSEPRAPKSGGKEANERDLAQVRNQLWKVNVIQAIVKKNQSLIKVSNVSRPSESSDIAQTMLEALYSIAFTKSSDAGLLKTIVEMTNTVSGISDAPEKYAIDESRTIGQLVEAVKFFSLAAPHVSGITKPTHTKYRDLVTKLKSTIEAIRRHLSTTGGAEDPHGFMESIGATSEFQASVVRKLRTSQVEGVTCLLGVLKGIK